jgi:stage II sporulation protein R
MFPPLCFIDTTSGIVPDSSKEIMEENLSNEEFNLISDNSLKTNVKFKIIEMFNKISIKFAEI